MELAVLLGRPVGLVSAHGLPGSMQSSPQRNHPQNKHEGHEKQDGIADPDPRQKTSYHGCHG
jgi:hypothetical protein